MKKILFLHGFFASGQCEPAVALTQFFRGTADVLTPDLPVHPVEALKLIHEICDHEHPDLIVGNSNGSFLGQIIAPVVGVPALLGNPHLEMTAFLRERIGRHQFKSPRRDGIQDFVIDRPLIEEFSRVQQHQFDFVSPYYTGKIWGLFGENDTLAHFEPLFSEYYPDVYHFPGGHTPTAGEVKDFYAPLAQRMLLTFNRPADGIRYFRHFKGGEYRLIRSAFDSETKERMAVYQTLYGEMDYWVRPERMFFERIIRNGRIINRFTEIGHGTDRDN